MADDTKESLTPKGTIGDEGLALEFQQMVLQRAVAAGLDAEIETDEPE